MPDFHRPYNPAFYVPYESWATLVIHVSRAAVHNHPATVQMTLSRLKVALSNSETPSVCAGHLKTHISREIANAITEIINEKQKPLHNEQILSLRVLQLANPVESWVE